MASPKPSYHHGNLPRALVDAAVELIGEVGPAAMSLREVARRAGVSSAAPAHHFGDKAGLFTAIAVEGHAQLASALGVAFATRDDFLDVGVAYVEFALRHPAYFEVMFRPDLHHPDAPELAAARRSTAELLYGPAARAGGNKDPGSRLEGLAAWSLVHGLATLVLSGNLPGAPTDDPLVTARLVAGQLFGRSR